MNCFPTKSHSLRLLIVLICSLSFNVQSASLQDQFQNKENQESTKALDNHKKFDDLLSSSLEDLFKKFEEEFDIKVNIVKASADELISINVWTNFNRINFL